jgi:hypothetical protein
MLLMWPATSARGRQLLHRLGVLHDINIFRAISEVWLVIMMVSEESPLLVATVHEAIYDRFAPDQKRWIVFLVSFVGLLPSEYWELKCVADAEARY